jgi:hypothetical protein
MRKVLTAGFAMAVALSATGPALADPARGSSASAFGIAAALAGTQVIPPTPTATATAPPDANEDRNSTVPLTAGTLTLTGALNAVAQARQADELLVALRPEVLTGAPAGSSEPINLAAPNARGFGSAANASVLVSAVPGLPDDAFELIQAAGGSLVTAGAVQAEAVAKCVGGRPQFDTAFNVVDLRLAGTQIPLVGDLVTTLVDLLGPDNPLATLVSITKGEVIPLADGVAINALRVRLLGVAGGAPLVDVVIGHAEVHMPADCAVAPPAPPTGPGPVAPVGNLAATGGDFSLTPVVAMVLLGGALGIRRLTVRARRSSTTVA